MLASIPTRNETQPANVEENNFGSVDAWWLDPRLDLAECLQFAGDGKVKVHYTTERLEDINSIFGRMRDNKIDDRVVMKI